MTRKLILVVEDDDAVAKGLLFALEDEGFDAVHAANGQDALEVVRSNNPDIILLDIRLPDISGFDVCRTLRQGEYKMPILMLTARDDLTDKILGLELGADDYIVKPYALKEVISRIRAQIRRSYGELAMQASKEMVRFGDFEVDPAQWQVRRSGQPIFLTPTEFRLLHHLVTRPNRVCSRSNLIEQVWGYSSDIGSDRSVDVHISHLRDKLEDDPADPRWIVTVRSVGYKFVP